MFQETYCKQIVTWSKGRAGEWSTWRGLGIISVALVTAVNPAAGLALGKAIAGVIGAVEIVRKES